MVKSCITSLNHVHALDFALQSFCAERYKILLQRHEVAVGTELGDVMKIGRHSHEESCGKTSGTDPPAPSGLAHGKRKLYGHPQENEGGYRISVIIVALCLLEVGKNAEENSEKESSALPAIPPLLAQRNSQGKREHCQFRLLWHESEQRPYISLVEPRIEGRICFHVLNACLKRMVAQKELKRYEDRDQRAGETIPKGWPHGTPLLLHSPC